MRPKKTVIICFYIFNISNIVNMVLYDLNKNFFRVLGIVRAYRCCLSKWDRWPPVGDLCPLTPTTYPFPINNRPKTSAKPNPRNSKTDLKLCLVDAYRPFCPLNRSNLCPELNVVCFVPFPYGQILVMSRTPGSDQRQCPTFTICDCFIVWKTYPRLTVTSRLPFALSS